MMNGISRWVLALGMLSGLTACVTEVHEYRSRITTSTSIHTDQESQKGGFLFRTVAGPLESDSEQVAYVAQDQALFRPDPALVQMGGIAPHFEPYSRTGNKDYTVKGQSYRVWRDIEQYSEEGPASWYGPGFHGQFTANGELYDQYSVSAAHKNLPIPCYIRVTNKENGRSLVVRVNDRGPFHDDRILDLSYGAAQKLGIAEQGVAQVRIDLIHPPRPANADELIARSEAKTIQLLATDSAEQARKAATQLSQKFGTAITIVNNRQKYRLHMGPMPPQRAEQMLAAVRSSGLEQAYFVY